MGTIATETQARSIAYEKFIQTSYWPALDGLRAFSIILVLLAHMRDPEWSFVSGALGVTLFFVVSGFLITTLLLREEKRKERVSLTNFYIRRSFRIIPLYAFALLVFSVLALGFGLGAGSENYMARLPLLATFNGDFAGGGTFSHSWSLGIEEKFYLVWPILAFGIAFSRRHRGVLLALLVPVATAASFLPGAGYAGIYVPILGGCALGLAANDSSLFKYVHALSLPFASFVTFSAMILLLFVDQFIPLNETSGYAHTLFSYSAVLALPAVLFSRTHINKVFSIRFITYIGTRAYAIYLFHPLCLHLVDRVLAPGSGSIGFIGARFVLVCALSVITGEVLYRAVEEPLNRLGRKFRLDE